MLSFEVHVIGALLSIGSKSFHIVTWTEFVDFGDWFSLEGGTAFDVWFYIATTPG